MGWGRLQRLSAEDERILALEHGSVVGHSCKVLLLDGAIDAARLRTAIAGRLGAAPRLRQRLAFLPRGFGRPLWVEDPDFDLTWHVRPADAESPLDDRALRDLVATRMQERLDRSRPLWCLEVVPMRGERTALVWQAHHCMADGFTAMRIGARCIWAEDGSGEPRMPAPGAAVAPGGLALLAAAALDRGQDGLLEVSRMARGIAAARRWRDGVAQARALAASARRELARRPIATLFDAPIGRRRAVAWRSLPLRTLHDAAKRISPAATLNDAVVALVVSGVAALSPSGRAPAQPLRVRIPVNLHAGGAGEGNRDSFIDIDVPLRHADVTTRLHAITHQTSERKAAHDAEHIDQLLRAAAAIPLGEHLVAHVDAPQQFSLCVSNVVGPRARITVAGVPVSALYSVVEIAEHHDLRASVISCGDTLSVALCADADRVDPEPLMTAVDDAWEELVRRGAPTNG